MCSGGQKICEQIITRMRRKVAQIRSEDSHKIQIADYSVMHESYETQPHIKCAVKEKQ